MSKNTHPKSTRPRGAGRRRNSQNRASSRSSRQRQRHLSVRGELRDKPDVRRIARAIIDMEIARLEAEAAAERQAEGQEPDA